MVSDTIAAISTPLGCGGIGIIRISGNKAFEVVQNIFRPLNPYNIEEIKTQTIKYGHIVIPESQEVLDEVLVSFFKEPKSFTGENTAEINCHGGVKVLKRILELTSSYGARIAEPGEFTKRAFLNGRLDLAQAEAVIEVINSKTNAAVKASLNQLEGRLSSKIRAIRNKIIESIADIEAAIDYPEYDIEEISRNKLQEEIQWCRNEMKKLERTFFEGRIAIEGIQVAIIGKPNVGKSSLLNALIQKDKAIITEIPGTTRDIIEEIVEIGGVAIKILDTAGLRQTEDKVEILGIEKTRHAIDKADLVLLVIDGSQQLSHEDAEIMNYIEGKKTIIIVNKTDLEVKLDIDEIRNKLVEKRVIKISAKDEIGIEDIEEAIKDMFINKELDFDNEYLVTNIRHKKIIEEVIKELDEIILSIDNMVPMDLVSVSITQAGNKLGEITGETVNEEVLKTIFSKFCIGK